ncbi:outer membrane lipoprotein-sorting protein [Halobacteriovorax marinus]|uniref:outer membrane lipoprotein-sorting protein n=1 Tax=Halobacteriovorax marinus TaxID=97084 RepID=UPI003A900E7C
MSSVFKFCLILILSLGASHSFAETTEEKGLRIAKEAEARNNGFIGDESDLEMILIDAYGSKIIRKMQGKVLEVENDGDKSLNIFLNPKDVKGTKMLTWSHKKDDDNQWLYLPSLKRVKKISSRNKSSSFMGSEFSYEDIGSQEIEKYKFNFIKDGKSADGEDVHIIERVPVANSGYSKQVVQISKKHLNAVHVSYYDRKNELLKTADMSDFKKYTVAGKELWRASNIHMKNVQTKKESIFKWNNRKLGVKFKENLFTKRALKR